MVSIFAAIDTATIRRAEKEYLRKHALSCSFNRADASIGDPLAKLFREKVNTVAGEMSSQAAVSYITGIDCSTGGVAIKQARGSSAKLSNKLRLETRASGHAKHNMSAFAQAARESSERANTSEEDEATHSDRGSDSLEDEPESEYRKAAKDKGPAAICKELAIAKRLNILERKLDDLDVFTVSNTLETLLDQWSTLDQRIGVLETARKNSDPDALDVWIAEPGVSTSSLVTDPPLAFTPDRQSDSKQFPAFTEVPALPACMEAQLPTGVAVPSTEKFSEANKVE